MQGHHDGFAFRHLPHSKMIEIAAVQYVQVNDIRSFEVVLPSRAKRARAMQAIETESYGRCIYTTIKNLVAGRKLV
jgi:hypothetical protein